MRKEKEKMKSPDRACMLNIFRIWNFP